MSFLLSTAALCAAAAIVAAGCGSDDEEGLGGGSAKKAGGEARVRPGLHHRRVLRVGEVRLRGRRAQAQHGGRSWTGRPISTRCSRRRCCRPSCAKSPTRSCSTRPTPRRWSRRSSRRSAAGIPLMTSGNSVDSAGAVHVHLRQPVRGRQAGRREADGAAARRRQDRGRRRQAGRDRDRPAPGGLRGRDQGGRQVRAAADADRQHPTIRPRPRACWRRRCARIRTSRACSRSTSIRPRASSISCGSPRRAGKVKAVAFDAAPDEVQAIKQGYPAGRLSRRTRARSASSPCRTMQALPQRRAQHPEGTAADPVRDRRAERRHGRGQGGGVRRQLLTPYDGAYGQGSARHGSGGAARSRRPPRASRAAARPSCSPTGDGGGGRRGRRSCCGHIGVVARRGTG